MVKYVCSTNQAGQTPLEKRKVPRIKGPCPPPTSKALASILMTTPCKLKLKNMKILRKDALFPYFLLDPRIEVEFQSV
jgi:hypothetical protein